MSFSKIALASLKYHRRMTTFYVIFLVISFFLLFIIDSLKISLPYIYTHMEDLLSSSGYSLEKQSILRYIQEPTETIGRYYDFVKKAALIFFTALFFIYFFICQIVKEKEYLIWKNSGNRTLSWVYLNLLETIFPLFFFILIFATMIMLLQHFFVGIILNQHLKIIEMVHGTNTITEQFGQDNLDHLVVRFPRTNQALIQTILLSSKEWTKILFISLGQTIRNFIFLIFPTQIGAIGVHYFWRHKFGTNN
ncbi:hypothetical protein LQF67_07860 [Tetragenococcus halophilus]|uniref:hypothetical protein n=1 Tax=Tetragenococcus halophilus TaxID=51669 RepID=UPI001F1E075F|nr:hypothetical protein [Tetragenococcus halophilus]MCF1685504.1 hypothetical protein [Tetragenococcus halophilus]